MSHTPNPKNTLNFTINSKCDTQAIFFLFIFWVNIASPESAFVPCKYIKSPHAAVEMTDGEMEAGNEK